MNNELGRKNYTTIVLTSCFFVFLLFCFFAFLTPAGAQVDATTQLDAFAGGAGMRPEAGVQDPRLVVARVIKGAIALIGTLFLAYTVYAGFLIMTSRGSEEQINKAKSTIRTAVIGVIITLAAYGIVQFVTDSLLVSTGAVEPENAFDTYNASDELRDQQRYQNRDPFSDVNMTP